MRIGLIGLGKAGMRHAEALRKGGEATIVAVADPAPAAARAAAELGAPLVASYETLLAEVPVDGVVISLPHALLAPAAIAAARAGVHVLLEKPMGVTLAEARAVVDACRQAGVRLMVNYVHRFRAEYRQALAALRAGAIGRPIIFVDSMTSGRGEMPPWVWRRELSGGGMLMYNGVHSLDRLAWLAGAPIAQVSAALGTFSFPVELEDNAVASMTFANGSLGVLVQHRSDAAVTLGGWQTMIYGTRGAMQIVSGSRLEIAGEKERVSLQVADDDRFFGATSEFVAAVREDREPSPSGAEGIHALAAALALYEAATAGRAIAVAE